MLGVAEAGACGRAVVDACASGSWCGSRSR